MSNVAHEKEPQIMQPPKQVKPQIGEPESWVRYPVVDQLVMFMALALLKQYRQEDPREEGLDHYERAVIDIGFTLPHQLDPFHVEGLVLKVEAWLNAYEAKHGSDDMRRPPAPKQEVISDPSTS
jgi:hypothetical protein